MKDKRSIKNNFYDTGMKTHRYPDKLNQENLNEANICFILGIYVGQSYLTDYQCTLDAINKARTGKIF